MSSRKRDLWTYRDYSSDEEAYGSEAGNVPDRSKSDFYCEICDSHMNSIQMWESHVTGKRHLKNKKKSSSELPSKQKSIKRDDLPIVLDRILKDVQSPIVGLDYICELQRADPSLDPTYTCYLCHGTYTRLTIESHLISTKHRMIYLREVAPKSYELIESLKMRKPSNDVLVEENAAEMEVKHGRGRPEVKVEKTKYATVPPRKRHDYEGRRYVDLDAPSTSRGAPSPDVSDTPEPAPAVAPSSSAMIKKLDVLDALRDVKMMTTDMQLQLLETIMTTKAVKPTTDSEVRVALNIIQLLSQSVMQARVRQLPYQRQQGLLVEVLNPTPCKTLQQVMGLTKDVC